MFGPTRHATLEKRNPFWCKRLVKSFTCLCLTSAKCLLIRIEIADAKSRNLSLASPGHKARFNYRTNFRSASIQQPPHFVQFKHARRTAIGNLQRLHARPGVSCHDPVARIHPSKIKCRAQNIPNAVSRLSPSAANTRISQVNDNRPALRLSFRADDGGGVRSPSLPNL
jgi:hypothetical protein